MKEPILGRTTIHEHALEMRFHVQDNTLFITPNFPSFSHLSLAVPLTDLQVETDSSPLTFKMIFKQKI